LLFLLWQLNECSDSLASGQDFVTFRTPHAERLRSGRPDVASLRNHNISVSGGRAAHEKAIVRAYAPTIASYV
jgi:hypothetical protein